MTTLRSGVRRAAGTMRVQVPQFLTLGLALLLVALGWAPVWDHAPWWDLLDVRPRAWWHLVPLALMAAAVPLRVRHPLAAVLAGSACVLLDLAVGLNLGLLFCLSELITSLGLRAERRTVRTVEAGALAVAALSIAAAFAAGAEPWGAFNIGLAVGAVAVLPLWWAREVRKGYPLWNERDVRRQLEAERHAALLRRQEDERRLAVAEERRHMARELHDVVSSQVSAIALTAGAVLNAEASEERDRRALGNIRTTSVEALGRLREMVQLLSGAGPEAAGAAGGQETWEGVLSRAERQGIDVHVDGRLPEELPPAVRQVALRVMQESLLNALKHGDARARVELVRRRRCLRLRITSGLREQGTEAGVAEERRRAAPDAVSSAAGAGPPDAAGPSGAGAASLGAGTGLAAMRERVRLSGGRFRAGPSGRSPASGSGRQKGGAGERAHGEWTVEAELPLKVRTHG
ncbi:sensor histidine kinase [Brevibacterium album]|uniref:sensor histidine kinase n=1 Tax=Brevibacterium album TaxID=417948 RepID=UPI00055752C2|nr:histidine kinase [Brevibacterium album]